MSTAAPAPPAADLARRFDAGFSACPLVAILRGITPGEIDSVGDTLVEAGFRLIEVPLNSPDPFASIARLQARHGTHCLIGAGTVTTTHEVAELRRIGAALVVSPHCDPEVIGATVAAGLLSIPGALTPSECFAAIRAGAHAVKLFPMEVLGIAGVKAMRAVLPASLRLIGVGGVDAGNIAALRQAGCSGFGIGGALYRPGSGLADIAAAARRFRQALE